MPFIYPTDTTPFTQAHQLTCDWEPELKFAAAAIYSNYTTTIIDDEDIEQLDGYISGPKGEKLILQFERAG